MHNTVVSCIQMNNCKILELSDRYLYMGFFLSHEVLDHNITLIYLCHVNFYCN